MVGVFNDYLHRLIENTEQFLRRIRWKAHFFLNPDTVSPSKETYGFKSTKNPPPIEELKDFEDDMLRMIQSVKFKQVNSPFLNKLKEDTDHIKNEPILLIASKKNPVARAVTEPGRPAIPNACSVGKHFGQRADKKRRCKVCAITRNARGKPETYQTKF